MKIQRLLAIVTYLLNRDLVTCKELSEKFEVSERTIQRDIDYINMAGIPIVSIRGINGGYKILDSYRVSKQTAGDEDLLSIQLALEALFSAMNRKNVERTLEKIKSISTSKSNDIAIDFSVVGENKKLQSDVELILEAINIKKSITFDYTNAQGKESSKYIEPISLQFKWYTWYFVGYDPKNKRYQIFKIIRLKNLKIGQNDFSMEHNQDKYNFESIMRQDDRELMTIQFECCNDTIPKIKEYIPSITVLEELSNVSIFEMVVPEGEFFWFSILFSLGDGIKILTPRSLQIQFKNCAQKMEEVFKRYFVDGYPARKTIQTEFAHIGGEKGLRIQIDGIAYCGH
ncbi:HTH domain protein [Clostridium tepidiprofundi DSM 19306]|uniref:HTH domain protein n=1 Tax=Clostridium tepidiprofundi DSM 19306 TaxID=1121338 RepID=A0A151ATM2_9CLOT|nr:YafY family protein [Clostridium tepidiprofundi]KYH30943.1 HTH domain protein [Clostridium tepidiprofundi DSM 19306]